MTTTTALRRELRGLYSATEAPELVTVPPITYLAVDGQGDPRSTEYTEAIMSVYTLAYAVRAELERAGEHRHRVMPLETTWAVTPGPDGAARAEGAERTWSWTTLIAQPTTATEEVVAAARAGVGGASRPRLLDRVALRTVDEGRSAQLLHTGPHGALDHDIGRLRAFIAARGLSPRGRHHEVYLSDPARTASRRLRTVLRQPVDQRIHQRVDQPAVGPAPTGP
jgi:hypothetical protein